MTADTQSAEALADKLDEHNRWRRDRGCQQPDPTALGADIDAAVAALRQVQELRAALQEADTIMGHDDSETQWREKWEHLWALNEWLNVRAEPPP